MDDIVNFIYCLILLLTISHYFSLKKWIFIVLLLHLCSIFIFNGFLFSPHYMSDQINYLELTQLFRNLEFSSFQLTSTHVASFFFAIFPMPFIDSVYSIGFINFLLYLFLFVFLFQKRVLNNKIGLYFYLFFPSLLLYSSLALRDFLVFSIMLISLYLLLARKQYLLSFIIIIPLSLLKVQNFIVLFIMYTIFVFVFVRRKLVLKLIIVSCLCVVAVYYEAFFALETLNKMRYVMYIDANGSSEGFSSINSLYSFLLNIVPDSIYFLFRPLPWIENNIFHLIQFLENLIIASILLYIILKEYRLRILKVKEIQFLNVYLLIFLVIYGLVVSNSGTAVRYKFSFISIYIIFSLYYIRYYIINKEERVDRCVE